MSLFLTLRMRLDKGIEYLNNNPKAYIVVSGGQGFQETVVIGDSNCLRFKKGNCA